MHKNKNTIKEPGSYRIFQIFNNFFLVLLAVICVAPFVHILAVSFSDAASTAAGSVGFLPIGFQLDAYKYIIEQGTALRAFGITILRMILGTSWSMLLTISAAYPLSLNEKELPGRKFFVVFFFITMVFSGGIIPYYILMKDLKLIDTIWALVLGGVPVGNAILLMNFFRTLPHTIYESASLDGASHFTILTQIYLPLAKPSIATLSLFCLVGHWNDWYGGLVYMQDVSRYPLQTFIYNAMQSTSSTSDSWSGAAPRQAVTAALICLSIIPIIVAFPVLQKHIKTGLVIGSVKE